MSTRTATGPQQQEIVRCHNERKAFLETQAANIRRTVSRNTSTLKDLQKQYAQLAPKVDTLKRWADAGQPRAQREYRIKLEKLTALQAQCNDTQVNGITNPNTRLADTERELSELERVGLTFESSDALEAVFAEIDEERQAGVKRSATQIQREGDIARSLAAERTSWWPFRGAKA